MLAVIWRALAFSYRDVVLSIARFWPIFGPFGSRWARPFLYRMMGVQVGHKVHIGQDVFLDPLHSHMVTIEDYAGIADRVVILAHRRDLNQYHQGMWIADCPYYIAPVKICRGASVGTGSIVLPGVTINEGAIIAAGTLVNKDIPPYTLAAGYPAKVLKRFTSRSA